jgi:5-methylcytosine-specific restriction protein A
MLGEEWRDPVDITKEQWMYMLEDRDIMTQEDVQLLKEIYSCKNYRATAQQLAQLLHLSHHVRINNQVGNLGKRIVKKLNISAPKYRYGKERGKEANWWNVPFWGEEQEEGFYWILRPELAEAICELHEMGEVQVGYRANLPEEIDFKNDQNFYEGAIKQIYVNSYERNDRARYLCILKYGTNCVICGFDFEKVYGEVGKNFIHVHHLTPLSEIKQEYKVDPEEHLRPVCPNCHAIIHKKNPPYSIDEVIEMIKNTKTE